MQSCKKCCGYGRLQIYRYGQVISVYCDCEAGDRAVEKVGMPGYKPKRLSDYPSLKDYYLNRP